MLDLTRKEEILLYHGSFLPVPIIDLNKCQEGKDFGKGFYLTTSYTQAKKFIPMSIKKQIMIGEIPSETHIGYISIYKLTLSKELKIHSFPTADKEWLHFIAENRRKGSFPNLRKQYQEYDIISGKIADDRTSRTLQLYLSNSFGDIHSEEADQIAINTLLPNRLEDQHCFLTYNALQCLQYLGSDEYDIRNK